MKKSINILLFSIGIALILIAYNRKNQGVSSYQENSTNITIIDLSQQNSNSFNYYLISGILLISVSLILSINPFNQHKKEGSTKPYDSLTKQERKIAQLIIEGKSNKEIANELCISLSTVKTHTHNIYKKLKVNSRDQLTVLPIN